MNEREFNEHDRHFYLKTPPCRELRIGPQIKNRLRFRGELVETRALKMQGQTWVYANGDQLECKDCGVQITSDTGYDIRCNFIQYVCDGQFVCCHRDMGYFIYCSQCGTKHKALFDTVYGPPEEGCVRHQ